MSTDADEKENIPGTSVFTGQKSRKGYALNRFAYSLHDEKNREAYRNDPDQYMDTCGLSDWEKEKVKARDWKALINDGGGSIYMLIKIGAVTGDGLVAIGAQQRGESVEEFMKSRNVPLRQNM